jgi:3-oxoacyl-(acyl-carrier-protein) synthase
VYQKAIAHAGIHADDIDTINGHLTKRQFRNRNWVKL